VARIWNVNKSLYRSVFFVLMLAMSACGQNSLYEPMDASMQAFTDESRDLSLGWLASVSQSGDAQVASMADSLQLILQDRLIAKVPSIYAQECTSTNPGSFVSAFVLSQDLNSNIYICPDIERKGEKFMAQVLIHEAIHLAGVNDECTTTELEIAVMQAAGLNPHSNSYVSRCGLSNVATFDHSFDSH